jgi:hypothetical protein
MRTRLAELKEIEQRVREAPDQQISLTDSGSRAMATNMRGASVVGYNVQAAVDTEHHLIVTHEATDVVLDRTFLGRWQRRSRASYVARRSMSLPIGATTCVRGDRSEAVCRIRERRTRERPADNDDFDYLPEKDAYRCPAGEMLPFRFASVHDEQNVRLLHERMCRGCLLKSRCTTGKERRLWRWEHEHVVDATRDRLAALPEAMTIRRTVEHRFGTLKVWMDHTDFLTKGLARVSNEMSLCVSPTI